MSVYRYLGVHINEHMYSSIIAETLSKAGGRALCAVISKIHSYKDVGLKRIVNCITHVLYLY